MPADTWPVDTPVAAMLDRVRARARRRRYRRRTRLAVGAATMAALTAVVYGISTPEQSRLRTTPVGTPSGPPPDGSRSDAPAPGTGGPPAGDGGRLGTGASPAPSLPTVTTSPLLTTTTTPPRQRVGSREIVYVRGNRLWTVDADGGEAAPLTAADPNHYAGSPDWAPDGRRLVVFDWHSDATGMAVGGLALVGLDGTMHRITPDNPAHTSLRWSPSGARIAYARARPQVGWSVPQLDPYVVNADGSADRRLSGLTGGRVDWVSDTRLVGFCPEGGALCTVNLDGTDVRAVPDSAGIYDFSVSPDGRRLAYQAATDDGGHAGVMDLDGTGRHDLLRRWNVVGIDWSSDGRTIVFAGLPDSDPPPSDCYYAIDSVHDTCPDTPPLQVWRMDADGSHRRALTTGPGDYQPTWRPAR